MIQQLPQEIFAVGHSFWDHSIWNRVRYGRIIKNLSVYDIPVRHPGSSPVFKDEIRVYPSKNRKEDLTISPDAVAGVVVLENRYDDLQSYARNTEFPEIPIFDPQTNFLGFLGK